MNMKNEGMELRINCPEELMKGNYSNIVVVQHSVSEFICDFILSTPGSESADVVSRIILTPDNAKRMAHILLQNIQGFEENFGEIKLYHPQSEERPIDTKNKNYFN